jgi:hypothetical protein
LKRHTFRAVQLACVTTLTAAPAAAKDHGLHSPGGRKIYHDVETFEDVLDTRLRRFVVEAAVGSGPEGNIAALLGFLNWPIHGLEYYGGFGLELNPCRSYTAAARYAFNIQGYRPYVGIGYLFRDVYEVGTFSHSAFLELGYSWVIHRTYRLAAGAGVRYLAHIGVGEGSPLRGPQIDEARLAAETDDVFPWTPTVALRFSRAF